MTDLNPSTSLGQALAAELTLEPFTTQVTHLVGERETQLRILLAEDTS